MPLPTAGPLPGSVSHHQVIRALEARFVEPDLTVDARPADPSEVPWSMLERHLATCESCRAHFDRLAHAARALERQPISSLELARAESAIFAGLDDAIHDGAEATAAPVEGDGSTPDPRAASVPGSERSRRAHPARSRSRPGRSLRTTARPSRHAVALLASLCLVAAATVYLTSGDGNGASPEATFQPRGIATLPERPAARPQLALFCARRSGDAVEFTGTDTAPFEFVSCPRDGGELKLAYANTSPEHRYGAFFGVGENGRIYWYGPTPTHPDAHDVRHTSALVPVGESIRLAVNHEAGQVRVHALFSAHPMNHATLARHLGSVPRRELFERGVLDDRIPGIVSTSRLFEVLAGDSR